MPLYVTLNPNDDVADLMDAVKIKCENSLSTIDATFLHVYPPGTAVPVSKGANVPALDPGYLVVDRNGEASSRTFVVVAPDIGTFSDLMRYLALHFHCIAETIIVHLILTYHIASSIRHMLASALQTKE